MRNTKNGAPPVQKISVTNIRGIKHVALAVEKHLVVIGGMNGAGKTSFATAIRATTGGMRGVDSLLREGAQEGRTVLDLGDRRIVRSVKRRKDGSETTSLEVIGVDGQPEQKPQERMDKLIRPLSFDPMAFFSAHPNEQVRMLLAAVGIDYAPLDREIERLEQERVLVGRERDKCKGFLAKYEPAWNPPSSPLDSAELMQQLAAAHRTNAEHERRRQEVADRERRAGIMSGQYQERKQALQNLRVEESRIVAEIARLTELLDATRSNITAAEEEVQQRQAAGRAHMEETRQIAEEVEQLENLDTSEIERMLADVEAHNAEYQRGLLRAQQSEDFAKYAREWDELDGMIQAIHQSKRKMLAEAPFPVQGLEIGERGITLDARPLHLLNTAEQLKLSLAIAYAQVDPDLPLIIVDQAERLDPSQLEIVRDMAEEAGVVTLAMRVATDGTCTIVLEDGQVLGAEQWAEEVLNGPLSGVAA